MKPLVMLGKYELLEKIGSGGMAEVYKARLTGAEGFEKVVVVKKILPGYARNKAFIDMLVEEAKLSSVLQHPNIVQTIELAQADSQFYIAMEYVNGRDLLKVLARCAERKATYPTAIASHVVAEVCKGLDYAHRARDIYGKPLNVIHRDVSPSNVIISWTGQTKVMDFGVAKARTQDAKGSKHVLRGKLGYMSPEQVRGEEIDHRSDIFSLGVVLFESLTLKRLFLGRTDLETLINIRDADVERKFEKYPFIEEPLRVILRRALAQDREKRYATALEFHDGLMEYLFTKKARVDSVRVEEFLAALFGDEAGRAAIAEMPPEAPSAEPGAPTIAGRSSTSPGVKRTAADLSILEDMVEESSPPDSFAPAPSPPLQTPAPKTDVTAAEDF
ncbi:MAG: serine/threonine protein kinase [Deltaproteobacteria bacterium]|nr:serine/threonine protein kinase [Deltaproteobacteria bacterium]